MKTISPPPIDAFGTLEPQACDLAQMVEVSRAFIDDVLLVKDDFVTITDSQKELIMFCLYDLEQRAGALRREVYGCIKGNPSD